MSKSLNLLNVSYIWGLTTQLPTFNRKDGGPWSRISYSHLAALVIIVDETCWGALPSTQASWQGAAHASTRNSLLLKGAGHITLIHGTLTLELSQELFGKGLVWDRRVPRASPAA